MNHIEASETTDVEKGVLACILLAPAEVIALCVESDITRESFRVWAHGEIYDAILEVRRERKPVDFITLASLLRDRGTLEKAGGPGLLNELFIFVPTAVSASHYIGLMSEGVARRRISVLLGQLTREHADGEPLNGALSELALLAGSAKSWKQELDGLRFCAATPPPDPPAVFKLGDATLATAGNLVALQAKAKAGKTAFLGAMLAAPMCGEDGDCFGLVSANAEGRAVLHFDTEQSHADHHRVVKRALWRAARQDAPPWLRSYCVTGLPLKDRNAAIRWEMKRAAQAHKGLHSVFLDGIGDLLADPNDPAEAFGLVDELHRLAIEFSTVIVCVLHENPGTEIGKTRGHLGSQLERKAESNIALAKDGEGVTVIYVERGRHCHVSKDRGPRFQWCDERQMHVSTQATAEVRQTAKTVELRAFAEELFHKIPAIAGLTWREIHDKISEVSGLSSDGARKRFGAMLKAHVIKKGQLGNYHLA